MLAVVRELANRFLDVGERLVFALLDEPARSSGAQRRASSLSVLTSRLR